MLERLNPLAKSFCAPFLAVITALEEKLVRLSVLGVAFGWAAPFAEGCPQTLGNFTRDLVLHTEQIGKFAIIMISP